MPVAPSKTKTTEEPTRTATEPTQPEAANGKPPASKKTSPKRTKDEGRPVLYPIHLCEICAGDDVPGRTHPPVTVGRAKDLLDWMEETDEITFGQDYLLTDYNGRKVRCGNNDRNRPYVSSLAEKYAQEILRGNWQLNGESIIIGRHGQTLAAQHRLIGLVLAGQEWADDPKRFKFWKAEPTLSSVVVFGVSEDEVVVNTIDTGKPRSLADVIYRAAYFDKYKPSDRRQLAKITEYAIRRAWDRTGDKEAFSVARTHPEMIDFFERHRKLLDAVVHVWEDNTEVGGTEEGSESEAEGKKKASRAISIYVSPGDAAGLLYLMGVSATDPDEYRKKKPPSEKACDFSRWKKALEFWTNVANPQSKALQGFRDAFSLIVEPSRRERIGLCVNAWNEYVDPKGKITKERIKLDYEPETEDTPRMMKGCPDVGGIDLGDKEFRDDETEGDES